MFDRRVFLTTSFAFYVASLFYPAATAIAADDDRWWPVQKSPAAVIRTPEPHNFPQPHDAYQFLLQSVAGLAAQGVNDGTTDQLVWVATGSAEIENWYESTLRLHSKINTRPTVSVWDLVNHYKQQGVIKGYILYKVDTSAGELNDHRKEIDNSVNVATSLAGILGGVLIDERIEQEAKSHGLARLEDARGKSQAWCFTKYRDQFHRRMLCVQDPQKPHVRDLAIAHRTFTMYGNDEPLMEALEWLEPPSPILGWNGGDEFDTTRRSSLFGHFQTATDWCMNLPVLMAGSDEVTLTKPAEFDISQIDWNDQRSGVAFVDTDGDNVQWLEGNFFLSRSYWSNPHRGEFPFGWSCCFTHLAQVCPAAIEYATKTRSPNDSFIEWGGGYYYPELFGTKRTNPEELLATHARRTWKLMQRSGTRIIGFNMGSIEGPIAMKAYQTFAEQTDGLLAILAFKYDPYEGGEGKTFWVKDGRGVEIPVITARYSIWEHTNPKTRPFAGTPAKIARTIQETSNLAEQNKSPRFDWTISHVWSYFQERPGTNESAEEMNQKDAETHGGVRGLTPTKWCIDRLPSTVRVISPEEMVWRVRMQHHPEQTRKELDNSLSR